MDKFLKIKYTDAKYTYKEEDLTALDLDIHHAYGKLSNTSNGDYILEYVVTDSSYFDNKISEGLILPRGAMISEYKKNEYIKNCNLEKIYTGDRLSITWKDVTHVVDGDRRGCSLMHTEGILHRDYQYFILLTEAKTIRTYPLPTVSHPQESPLYYVIPKSFIVRLDKI